MNGDVQYVDEDIRNTKGKVVPKPVLIAERIDREIPLRYFFFILVYGSWQNPERILFPVYIVFLQSHCFIILYFV